MLEPGDDPAASLDRIDGLLLTGGADVDPAEYGERAHPTVDVDRRARRVRDSADARRLAPSMPLLAICRGVQVLNVAAQAARWCRTFPRR